MRLSYKPVIGAMEMRSRVDGDLLMLEVVGDITFFNVGQVINEIDQSRRSYQITRVALNAGQVPMIDSAAFGALVSKARQLMDEGGYLRLVNPHPGIVNALHRIHLEAVLPSYGTLEEAIRPN